jgi:hypothetical protein
MKPERRTTPLAALVVALLAPVPVVSAATSGGQTAAQVRGYYVCYVDDGKATPTTYLSEVFPADVRPGPIKSAFRDFVTSNYHERIPLPGECSWSDTEAQAREKLDQMSGGSKVVQTNWKYTAAKPS